MEQLIVLHAPDEASGGVVCCRVTKTQQLTKGNEEQGNPWCEIKGPLHIFTCAIMTTQWEAMPKSEIQRKARNSGEADVGLLVYKLITPLP